MYVLTALLPILLGAGAFAWKLPRNTTGPQCKVVPGDAAWPCLDTWAQLNASVDGRLLQPAPPGAVCHPDHRAYNATQCPRLQSAWMTHQFHAEHPISNMWNNWNGDCCLPNASMPCTGTGYPVYVINATTVAHVQAGVRFAKKNNIRLVVKNSGHDYVGRSTAANSLSIWVHHMKGIKFHGDGFRPKGCNFSIDGAAITARAGTQMQEAYRETDKYNYTVVGGNGQTVALGGFLAGGGHSILGGCYGMAADHVLEMEIVTPNGDILTANECQNTDLFWALRGGGAMTYGIMTSATIGLVPSPQVVNFNFWIAGDQNSPVIWDMVSLVTGQFPSLSDQGVSGYPIVFQGLPNQLDNGNSLGSGMIGKVIMLDTDDAGAVLAKFQPIFATITAMWPGAFYFYQGSKYYPTFWQWYQENYDGSGAGTEDIVASRLLDEAALTGGWGPNATTGAGPNANLAATKTTWEQFSAQGTATAFIVGGKGVMNATPRGGGNAVNPAWRKTYVHATASVANFSALNATDKSAAIARANYLTTVMKKLAPNMGAYMNEGNPYDPDWKQAFWGDHYPRLLDIKRKVDPDDVLWCHPCVGNERWQPVGDKLCRVDSSST